MSTSTLFFGYFAIPSENVVLNVSKDFYSTPGKCRDNPMNTMVIPGTETQGNKVIKVFMEILGFSNDGSKKEFKEITQEIAQEVLQNLVAMDVKCKIKIK